MSEKAYDYPYFDLSKPFDIDGVNVKIDIKVVYELDDNDNTNAKYLGLRYGLINAEDELLQVKLTACQWQRIHDLIELLDMFYRVVERIGYKTKSLTVVRQTIADGVKSTTFGDMFNAVTKDPKHYDALLKPLVDAWQLCNRNKRVSYYGRRDTSDDGLSFTDICKDIIWPFF